MTKEEILDIIPHGGQCLLIDRAVILSPTRARAAFDCTGEEYFFSGHYPDEKILPGHMVVEAMGQTGALLVGERQTLRKKKGYLVTIEKMRFRQKMIPPFRAFIDVCSGEERMNLLWLRCRLETETGITAAEGTIVIRLE